LINQRFSSYQVCNDCGDSVLHTFMYDQEILGNSFFSLTKQGGVVVWVMGDVMSYLANIASELNLDLEKETIKKFNKVSEILDSEYRLSERGP